MKNSHISSTLRWGIGAVLLVSLLGLLHTAVSCGSEDTSQHDASTPAGDGDAAGDGDHSASDKFAGTWVVSEGSLQQACGGAEPTSVDTKDTKFTFSRDHGMLVMADKDCKVELTTSGDVGSLAAAQTCSKSLSGGGMVTITYKMVRFETKDGSTGSLTSAASAKSESPQPFDCQLSVTAKLQKEQPSP